MLTSQLFDVQESLINTEKSDKCTQILIFNPNSFNEWVSAQDEHVQRLLEHTKFSASPDQATVIYKENGSIQYVLAGIGERTDIYRLAFLPAWLQAKLPSSVLDISDFKFTYSGTDPIETDPLGWALGTYSYNIYKETTEATPRLIIKDSDLYQRSLSQFRAISLLRNLVNTPANDLGPEELEATASELAALHKAKFSVTKGDKLTKEFPIVSAVGQAAADHRKPRLIEMHWGKEDHPHIALVGKGVCFDTGGLDLKPSQFMKLMKKDMGGAAHVLALADMIMAANLPVRLSVIIPAVENCVGGNAFRPGDVFTARNGLTVENTDTDAEGRLILSDALTYASEGNPDIIIDFATLTGSARAALGVDIPAVFTNDPVIEDQLRHIPKQHHDMVWPMPLHDDYKSILKSDIADLVNHAAVPGDLMYSALFLSHFIHNGDNTPKWIHVDCFAWESNGRPGRTKGGKDTGLRGIYALIEENYC